MKTLWDYQKEQESNLEVQDLEHLEKNDQVEQERQQVLENVSGYVVNTIRDRVAWVLNHHPETRDSDIALMLKYWELFQPDLYDGQSIRPENLYHLQRETSIVRARAKIQNEYKLFLASPEVRKFRGQLSEEEKEKVVADKPVEHVYSVYMDESGKNEAFLIIGSVWFLSNFQQIHRSLYEIKQKHGFKHEFHFTKMDKLSLPIYMEAVDTILKESKAVSFKYITVERAGFGKVHDAITDMYYHLLCRGIEHEDESGRAPLPRRLQVWFDAEEVSLDRLTIATLKDRLMQASNSLFDSNLKIDHCEALDSGNNTVLQIADLFTGSINRLLNKPSKSQNHKDDLAEHFLSGLNIQPGQESTDQVGDLAIHISV
jgi:hypothetical protein